MHLAPVVQQGVFQHHTLGQEEGEAGAFVPQHEQAQFAAQLAVIPLLGLFNAGQIFVQFILLGEGNAVDPLQGLPVGIAPPVCGVAGGQLQGVALDAAGGVQMGAGAQVGKFALLVEGDGGVFGQILDQLNLEGLALFFHKLQRLGPGQFIALQLQLFLADLFHFSFDLLQVLGGKGKGGVHVVVPALGDGGADGQLHFGPQALDSLGHHMGAGVPIGFAVSFVLKSILVVFFCHKYSSL